MWSSFGILKPPLKDQTASGGAANACESWFLPPDRHRPEPPLPAAEVAHGVGQVGAAEVGPHAVGEDQLGVGALPEQEVREPLLAAGADQQVHVGGGTAVVGRIGEQAREGFAGELALAAQAVGGAEDGVAR